MTLEEAIKHVERMYKANHSGWLYGLKRGITKYAERCKKSMNYNRQLAEWLRELQERRKQSEIAKLTDESAQIVPNEDLISRKSAIDAAIEAADDWDGGCSKERERFIREALEDLPSAQPEQRWIPCSDRLPEHGGRYLISVFDGIGRKTTIAPYLPRCKAWAMTGRRAYWKVIAWMPLPEPWKEGEDE